VLDIATGGVLKGRSNAKPPPRRDPNRRGRF
jgi:hypothetical protein